MKPACVFTVGQGRAVSRFAAGGQVDVQDPTGNPMCHPIASLQNSLGLQQDPNNFTLQAVNGALMTPSLRGTWQHMSA